MTFKMIRNASEYDASAICDIYNYYILNSISTFELEPVSVEEIKNRIHRVIQRYPWIVYEEDDEIIGYAYADEWKTRKAYKYSVESTIYLKNGHGRKGIGSVLYKFLLEEIKKAGIHAVIGGISLPNEASIALHEKFGFKEIACFKEVGRKFDKWIDVGYWELIIK